MTSATVCVTVCVTKTSPTNGRWCVFSARHDLNALKLQDIFRTVVGTSKSEARGASGSAVTPVTRSVTAGVTAPRSQLLSLDQPCCASLRCASLRGTQGVGNEGLDRVWPRGSLGRDGAPGRGTLSERAACSPFRVSRRSPNGASVFCDASCDAVTVGEASQPSHRDRAPPWICFKSRRIEEQVKVVASPRNHLNDRSRLAYALGKSRGSAAEGAMHFQTLSSQICSGGKAERWRRTVHCR
jgi:hypothetical protein